MKKTKPAKKKKPARKAKVTARTKTTKRKVTAKKTAKKAKSAARPKTAAKKKPAAKKKRASRPAAKEIRSSERSTLGGATFSEARQPQRRGRSASAGQAGDLQGLSDEELVDSESVEELAEEGQALEASAVSGVEDALEPDEGEVRTRQVPEDDVPKEYDED